jgi:xanthine dehydrogenase
VIIAATAPVAGIGPSAEGPVTSGFVAMKRAPSSIKRMAWVRASML